jgi:glycine dehydrogenase subunit 1
VPSYAARRIAELPGYGLPWGEFFKEFAVRTPRPPREINADLWREGIIGGYDLGRDYPELANHWLLSVTEMNPRQEIDQLVEVLGASPARGASHGREA